MFSRFSSSSFSYSFFFFPFLFFHERFLENRRVNCIFIIEGWALNRDLEIHSYKKYSAKKKMETGWKRSIFVDSTTTSWIMDENICSRGRYRRFTLTFKISLSWTIHNKQTWCIVHRLVVNAKSHRSSAKRMEFSVTITLCFAIRLNLFCLRLNG